MLYSTLISFNRHLKQAENKNENNRSSRIQIQNMNWYYEIWLDGIAKAKKTNSGKSNRDKMITLLVAFSIAQGLNLVSIYFLVGSFVKFNPLLKIDFFPGQYLNTAFSGFLTFYLPFFIGNYFLIFYKNRFLKLMRKRRLHSDGKAFIFYFFFSGLLFFGIILFGKVFLV